MAKNDLIENLKKIKLTTKDLSLIIVSAAEAVVSHAKTYGTDLMPVDTGHLRNSGFPSSPSDIASMNIKVSSGVVEGEMGFSAEYAAVVHEGREIKKKDGGSTHVAGKPFLRTAIAEVDIVSEMSRNAEIILRSKIK
jgi:hypothetical protein